MFAIYIYTIYIVKSSVSSYVEWIDTRGFGLAQNPGSFRLNLEDPKIGIILVASMTVMLKKNLFNHIQPYSTYISPTDPVGSDVFPDDSWRFSDPATPSMGWPWP